jgi:hypothetical protein
VKFNLKNPSWPVGVIVLLVGAALLVFTFMNAYTFLMHEFTISASDSLPQLFSSALAPLITACIHIIYLGVMGWIGAMLTTRGIRLMIDSQKAKEESQAPESPS